MLSSPVLFQYTMILQIMQPAAQSEIRCADLYPALRAARTPQGAYVCYTMKKHIMMKEISGSE